MTLPLRPYVFHRAEGWYPLDLANDFDAALNALANKGTLRVTHGLTGAQVWPFPESSNGGNGSRVAVKSNASVVSREEEKAL